LNPRQLARFAGCRKAVRFDDRLIERHNPAL